MFGETFTDVPIIEVSMNSSLDPDDEWALGAAVSDLRNEGLLVLAGGLTIHNLRDFAAFNPDSAGALYHEFDQACLDAVTIADVRLLHPIVEVCAIMTPILARRAQICSSVSD
jgi:aromatic ring-opening dioxygenase catalytic subunit (LigB family)